MEKIIVAFESEKTALRVKELLEGGGAAACLVCRTADQDRLDLLGNDDIFRLPSPVSRGDLLAAVRLLLQVGRRLERYGRPCHSGEDRRLIDRAKALLMDRHGITEEQAHYYLQKKSMDSRIKLAQTARLVLDSKTMA